MEKYVHSEEGDSPLIIAMPHSAKLTEDIRNDLPDFVKDVVKLDDSEVLNVINGGVDVSVPEITNFHNQSDHTRIWTDMPRCIIDTNRTLGQVDGLSVEGRGRPEHANGLIWRTVPPVTDSMMGVLRNSAFPAESKSMLRRPYTNKEFQELLDLAYHPFIKAIRDAAEKAVNQYGHAIIVAPHSFPAYVGTKVLRGEQKGAYIVGPPAQKSTRKASSTREFLSDMLLRKKLPDLIKITHPEICSPVISKIVDEEFEKKGNISSDGYWPFEVMPGDAEFEQGDITKNIHFIALEQVAHDGLEPNRHLGGLEVNMKVAETFRPIYENIFNRLAALKTEDIRM
ncbi:N-formylglutamate amidohydrolase [Candidatus Peregrinibacteria bacterium]|nr:N-formylglutamate amidohydrolase [Candidatus Peregrinibacteria bacterium]